MADQTPELSFDEFAKNIDKAKVRLERAIGGFAVEFAALEAYLNKTISVLLQLQTRQVHNLLHAAIRNVSTRLDILESLIHGLEMNKSIRDEMASCVADLRELNGYRNWLLHDAWGAWAPDTDEWSKIRPRTDSRLRYQHQKFSPKAINIKSNKCRQVAMRLSGATSHYAQERDFPFSLRQAHAEEQP